MTDTPQEPPERIWLTEPYHHPLRDSLRIVHETPPPVGGIEYARVSPQVDDERMKEILETWGDSDEIRYSPAFDVVKRDIDYLLSLLAARPDVQQSGVKEERLEWAHNAQVNADKQARLSVWEQAISIVRDWSTISGRAFNEKYGYSVDDRVDLAEALEAARDAQDSLAEPRQKVERLRPAPAND